MSMLIKHVQQRVAAIQEVADEHDHEVAHIREDELYRDVLKHIATHSSRDGDLAREALKAHDIKFSRYAA